jgi:hypothetical protein
MTILRSKMPRFWTTPLLLTVLLAACGDGSDDDDGAAGTSTEDDELRGRLQHVLRLEQRRRLQTGR